MSTVPPFALPDTAAELLVLAAALIILWIVVSIPVYIAGSLVTTGKGDFGDAMGATLGGALGYVIVLWGGTFLLSVILPVGLALVLSFVLALVVWVAVYAASFDVSWWGGAAIAIVGWATLVLLDFFLVSIFGVGIPKFYPF